MKSLAAIIAALALSIPALGSAATRPDTDRAVPQDASAPAQASSAKPAAAMQHDHAVGDCTKAVCAACAARRAQEAARARAGADALRVQSDG